MWFISPNQGSAKRDGTKIAISGERPRRTWHILSSDPVCGSPQPHFADLEGKSVEDFSVIPMIEVSLVSMTLFRPRRRDTDKEIFRDASKNIPRRPNRLTLAVLPNF